MTDKHLPFFVYGTLRNPNGANPQGNYRWALAGRTTQEQTATLDNAIMHANGTAFPFVRHGDEFDGKVVGEVMHVSAENFPSVLDDLDSLEGYRPSRAGNLYERTIVTVTLDSGEQVQAYTYQPSAASYATRIHALPVIESGDWMEVALIGTFR